MCGIQGFFDHSGSAPEGLCSTMGFCQRHRGPDDHGVFESGFAAIGNMRLSIIDLESGHQPVVSADGQVALVQNGEIYNYIELRDELIGKGCRFETESDTEVLLHGYLTWGKSFVSRLTGMFGIAIWDARSKELHLFRDALGVKPLFLCDQGGRTYFASEIKAILAAGVPRSVDHEALHHFLSYGFVPPPYTLFAGIRHLMPGWMATVSQRGTELAQWWHPADTEPVPIGESDFAEQFLSLLEESVRLRMRADVPFGAFLSGGLDSSTVVGLMGRFTDEPVKSFSIGFHDERFDESEWGKMAAARFGTDHRLEFVGPEIVHKWVRAVYHCDQPHSDVSFLPTMRLSELAVQHVKMVLTGDGGDELFGGYTKYSSYFEKHGFNQSTKNFCDAYHRHITLFDEGEKRAIYTSSQSDRVVGLDSCSVTESWLKKVPQFDRVNQALWLDVALLLPGNNLVKPDRMAMAVSLEARDPFLDKHLAEFALSVPGDLKVRGEVTRYAYKRAVAPLLGDELTYRPKRMFTVPIGEWFKDVLAGFTRGLLHSDRFLERGLFEPEVVNRLLEEHESGQVDHTRQIRLLLALEIWFRLFIDREELSPHLDEESLIATV
ncbi:MAG: asparagine synthase (glutamine-hydrolyzing) [Armatimonadetes bacterium]|nr:asparagine synthase (glutamine-hydrolyzing) [Armatimonadota bacterium]MBX3108055.1 asparagine synthase (glutamine-hydrolyzing) [Fimbriimonadaceae bacterium]